MSKRNNQLVEPLIFRQRGGRSTSGCHEIVGTYLVGARTRKQGLALLKNAFGKTATFFMPNGYGNNRQTERFTAKDTWFAEHNGPLRLPLGGILSFEQLPDQILQNAQSEPYGVHNWTAGKEDVKAPAVVKASLQQVPVILTPKL